MSKLKVAWIVFLCFIVAQNVFVFFSSGYDWDNLVIAIWVAAAIASEFAIHEWRKRAEIAERRLEEALRS